MTFEELPKPIPLGNSENLIGKRFDELVVLYRTNYSAKRKGWACLCDCGEYCVRRGDNLKADVEHTCNEKYHYANKLVGKTFGRLTIAKRMDEYHLGNGYKYLCFCNCGNPNPVFTWQTNFQTEHDQSCGCIRYGKKDLTGQRFGMLTAVKNTYTKSCADNSLLWECKCDCGETCFASVSQLTGAEKTSCGNHGISYGEINICEILKENKVSFKNQKLFDECRFPIYNAKARFDFYVCDKDNFLLEFDGEQHFKPNKNNKGWNNIEQFVKTHNRDLYKNQWAWDNGIPMKRIPYNYKGKLTLNRIMSDEYLITPQTHPGWYPPKNSSYPYFTIDNIDNREEVS